MKVNYNNKEVNIEVIGGFKIEDLDKEYILCSFDDDSSSDNASVVICEITRDGDNVTIADIPENESDMILLFYKTMKEDMLGSENNE